MISSQFADSKHLPYRLYAVFMHQGSVEFGHYYIYIYDFKKEIWRKYNDNEIIEVQNTAEIFSNQGRANPATPYFLVYVNGAMRERLVDPVCREIVPPPNSSATEHLLATDTTAVDAKYQADTDVDMDMEPPAYEEAWTAGDHSGMHAKSLSNSRTRTEERKKPNNWAIDDSTDTLDAEW
jgi:ubiquitin carboxyl-terminal hydrolase 25/28